MIRPIHHVGFGFALLLVACSTSHSAYDGGLETDGGPPTCTAPAPGPDCVCDGSGWICGSTCPADVDPWDPSATGSRCTVEGESCSSGSGPCGGGLFCTCEGGRWLCGVAEPDPVCWCGREPTLGDPCSEEGSVCGECCPSPESWPAMVCSGGRWEATECPDVACPPPPPPGCPVETAAAVGTPCGAEGQTCGNACCGNAITCAGGLWQPGPEAACACTPGFSCGSGVCNDWQVCESYCGPDDGVLFQCVDLLTDCGECGCLVLEPWQTCEMIDGHIYIHGAVCG